MLTRRGFMLGSTLPLLAATQQATQLPTGAPKSEELGFVVMRAGSRIGAHRLKFLPHPNGMDIQITVDITVRLGPITLFHYGLRGLEQWRGGQCTSAAANTNDDGTKAWMVAKRDAQGLWVSGSKAERYLAPANALVASHWNKAELKGPWINLQNGKLFHPDCRDAGPAPVLLADGVKQPAERYIISGDVHLEMWYDGPIWCGLVFTAKDGSEVRYEKLPA